MKRGEKMFFRKRKAPPIETEAKNEKMKTTELIRTNPLPNYYCPPSCDDFGNMRIESYGGLFEPVPWVRISFSLPWSDWSQFQKSSCFEKLDQFLTEVSKRNNPQLNQEQEDLTE